MVGCQKKTLPLVGLVASLPTALGFAPTRHGSSAIDASPSADAEASRRAFLVASSSTLVGTLFARPAKADVGGRFKLKHLLKPKGPVDSSDSESDDSDSDSDDSSKDEKEAAAKEKVKQTDASVPTSVDVPAK